MESFFHFILFVFVIGVIAELLPLLLLLLLTIMHFILLVVNLGDYIFDSICQIADGRNHK